MPNSGPPSALCLLIVFALLSGSCSLPASKTVPIASRPVGSAPRYNAARFCRQEIVDPASLAVAANHFIAMGEQQAAEELLKEDKAMEATPSYRLFWICRIIFEGREAPINPPGLGGLYTLPQEKMKPEDWPQLPLAESQGVYFLLSEYYFLGGIAETFPVFLSRCRKMGKFRDAPVQIPSRQEAATALEALIQEPRWKRLENHLPTGTVRSGPDISSSLDDLNRQVAAVPE